MKLSLWPIIILAFLANCGSEQATTNTAATPGAAPAPAPAGSSASPEVTAALVFADSIAALPKAEKADVEAARRYAQAVTTWQASNLKPSVKRHPVAESAWNRYRGALRLVVSSRGMKRVKPEDDKTWNDFTPQLDEVTKILLPLTEEPEVTASEALLTLINVESGYGSVLFAAQRHMKYLKYPQTRNL